VLVDDTALAQGGAPHFELSVPGVLLEVPTFSGAGPQVVQALVVAHEVEAALPPHGTLGGSRQVQALGLSPPRQIEAPQLRRRAATVMTGVVPSDLEALAGEEDGLARLVEGHLIGIHQGQHPLGARGGMHAGHHRLARGSLGRLGDIGHFALGAPPQHPATAEGKPLGHPACRGHDIGLWRTLVTGREGDPGAIRRKGRPTLLPGVGGQPRRHAARQGRGPQIPFRGEHHLIATHRRETVVAPGVLGAPQGAGAQGEHQSGTDHGTSGLSRISTLRTYHAKRGFKETRTGACPEPPHP